MSEFQDLVKEMMTVKVSNISKGVEVLMYILAGKLALGDISEDEYVNEIKRLQNISLNDIQKRINKEFE